MRRLVLQFLGGVVVGVLLNMIHLHCWPRETEVHVSLKSPRMTLLGFDLYDVKPARNWGIFDELSGVSVSERRDHFLMECDSLVLSYLRTEPHGNDLMLINIHYKSPYLEQGEAEALHALILDTLHPEADMDHFANSSYVLLSINEKLSSLDIDLRSTLRDDQYVTAELYDPDLTDKW